MPDRICGIYPRIVSGQFSKNIFPAQEFSPELSEKLRETLPNLNFYHKHLDPQA